MFNASDTSWEAAQQAAGGASPEHVLGEARPASLAPDTVAQPPLPLEQGSVQTAIGHVAPVHAAPTEILKFSPLCREDLQHGSRRSTYLAERLAGIAWSEAQLARSVDATLAAAPAGDIWVFGYGSLIWNPLLHYTEKRTAKIYGAHRSFCLWSRVNRGTPEAPGLVLWLDRGGDCAGVVYRVERAKARDEMLLMWRREMSTGAYIPRWIRARTPLGTIRALCFVIDHRLPSYAGRLDPCLAARTIHSAAGLYGPCIDYFNNTAQGLVEHGIEDHEMNAVGAALRTLSVHAPAQSTPDSA